MRSSRLHLVLGLTLAAAIVGCSSSSVATSSTREAEDARATSSAAPSISSGTPALVTRTATPTASATSTPEAPPSAPLQHGYKLDVFIDLPDMSWMLGFEVLPGGTEALVLTKTGQIWRVGLSQGTPTPPALFGDISDRLIANPHVEEGLLGLALSPTYEVDGEVYLHYTAGEPRRGVLARFLTPSGVLDPASEEVLLEVDQPHPNHNGGHIAFGPDGYLYVALGDGGDAFDPHGNGQDVSNLLSTLLRIDVSGETGYTIPADNPFAGRSDARPEIFAYGLRNPWRFSFDRKTGDLWAGDVGQDDWEEINRIVPGGNYGWSSLEGSMCRLPDGCENVGAIAPRASHSRESNNQAIVGGYVYRGTELPELDGWLVYGDWGLGKVWALDTTADAPPVVLMDTEVPIMSFGQLPDGEIVVVGFDSAIYKLARS